MPIFLVNPAPKRAKRTKKKAKGSIRRVSTSTKRAKKPSRKPAARKPATNNPKGKKKMAIRRKRQTAAQKRAAAARRRRRVSNPRKKRKSPKRVAAGKKAARTRKRNKTATRARKRAPVRRRKKNPARKRRTLRRNPPKGSKKIGGVFRSADWQRRSKAAKKGWRNKGKKKPARKTKRTRAQAAKYSSYGLKGQKKSRKRTLRAKKRKGAWRTQRYMKKHGQLKVNPSGKMGGMMGAVKQVLPLAGAFYVSRLAANKLKDIPAIGGVVSKLNVGGYDLAKPAISGVIMAAAHYGTKKGKLSKHRTSLMLGTALAFVDSLVAAFAPADVKSMIGMGEYVSVGEYVPSGEYVSTGEYVATGSDLFHQEHGASLTADPHGLYAVDGLHEVHAIHGIDADLGAIEAGADVGVNNGIFANGW